MLFDCFWMKVSLTVWLVWMVRSFLNPSRNQQEKRNTPCWECMRSLTSVTNHTKISYSIASLVFRKFSYRTYRNGLARSKKLRVTKIWQEIGIQNERSSVKQLLAWLQLSQVYIFRYCHNCFHRNTEKVYTKVCRWSFVMKVCTKIYHWSFVMKV